MSTAETVRADRLSRDERRQRVLDVAQRLFYARGVHEVGVDELVRETGLGKATVYRLFPTKDELVAAYLNRLAAVILAEIDAVSDNNNGAEAALAQVIDAIEQDIGRSDFRGCAFNNASIEFDDRLHPARAAARSYREQLLERLTALSRQLAGHERGGVLGRRLAVIVDGAYTSAAHLGPDGPAAEGLTLARELIAAETARR